jgi:putative DNA primase/helicase
LVDGLPKISNLGRYAEIVKQHALARRAINQCDAMSRRLETANGNVPEALREVSTLSASLSTSLRQGGSPATPVLRAVSVTELLRMDMKAREMVLHPFLPTQGLAMLYSQRGVGKTFIALGISVAVASGTNFLKWSAPTARRVLYVDGEMPCSTLKQRISDIVAGTDIAHPLDNLRVITSDLQNHALPDLSTIAGQDLIEAHLDGVELLVLDNLSSLVRAVKENEGEGWLPVQDWALDLRRRGISVLFVHHAGKAGAQRGTSRREDLLDSVVNLKHPTDYTPSEGLRCDVYYDKSRGFYGNDARSFGVKLMAGPSGEALWTVADPETSIEERVLELHRLGGMSVRDIADEMGLKRSKVHRIIKGARSSTVPVSQE